MAIENASAAGNTNTTSTANTKEATAKMETKNEEVVMTENFEGQEAALTSRMKRLEQANSSVKSYTLGSIAVGFVPVPLADMAALSAVQLKMVHSIAAIYEVPFSKNLAKSIIGSLIGGSIAVTLAMPVASLIKVIPFVGQTSGSLSTALIGSASTYAIGKIFVEHFQSGGTFLDFDEEKARNHFKELYEEGRAFVSAHKAATA